MFGDLDAEPVVYRNDALTLAEAEALKPERILLSPGPGHPANPRDFGICAQLLGTLAREVPTLGVCLGHQGLAVAFGGRVVRAPQPVHGKPSRIYHDGRGVFRGLPNGFPAGRYHSLVVARERLPSCLEVSAQTEDGLIMGLRHKAFPIEGIQFHPESILTDCGYQLLRNFLKKAQDWEVGAP